MSIKSEQELLDHPQVYLDETYQGEDLKFDRTQRPEIRWAALRKPQQCFFCDRTFNPKEAYWTIALINNAENWTAVYACRNRDICEFKLAVRGET